VELNDYQQRANRTDRRPARAEDNQDEALVWPLMGLASEVGSLVNQYKKRVRDGDAHDFFSDRVADELGDCLWYTANLATKLGLSLDDIACRNLQRTGERWAVGGEEHPFLLLDDESPEGERLPRTTWVRFEESQEGNAVVVRLWSEGGQVGNDLKDMSWDDDGYRFHDAFHLTYAALLGWSPITRSFFDCARKSNEKLREVEDSGRAKVIEEAIAAFLFEYARRERFLKGVSAIDFCELETIRALVSGLEVRVRTAREWEHAILRSFEVWRALRAHGGGTVHLDLPNRRIDFEPPS
jgi:NTP pyrophosphatase (non-canonical NTP hydrolase)